MFQEDLINDDFVVQIWGPKQRKKTQHVLSLHRRNIFSLSGHVAPDIGHASGREGTSILKHRTWLSSDPLLKIHSF